MPLDTSPQPPPLDPDNPWPGLSWFDERGAAFFKGRDREIAELERLVAQAPLTVLFGKSGLGKTSLLKAGLFPRLGATGMLPIYARFDFAAGATDKISLIEQLAGAFAEACVLAGAEAPPRSSGQSFWEYLHHTDFKLWSRQNQPLTPVFVVDQFEEVFTLGAARSAAVAQLREDLADLIENRIPTRTEARLVADEKAGDLLALRSQRYRVLLSFREDFATAFERWRELPSLMRNRIQLGPLSGEHALDAAYEAATHLLDRSTAVEIVRFVAAARPTTSSALPAPDASATPLADLIVEPALLSLVCRGLNERRKRDKKARIDHDMLAGTAPGVVDAHYDECMGDQPERAHRFVECELVTESGFRKPCAQDDAQREPYGVTLDQLRLLVDRRLLRIEPSLGVTRVELIHDLLAPTVVTRRDVRRKTDEELRLQEQLRQQQAEREQTVAAEHERQQAARRLQRRTGWTLGAALLAVVFGLATWYAEKEAQRADREADRARQQAIVAQSREAAAAAVAHLDLEPELALALAVEAATIAPTLQAESALRQALLKTRPQGGATGAALEAMANVKWLTGHDRDVLSVSFSPDGTRILSTSCDKTARLWDAQTGALLHVLADHRNAVMVGAFSPDGKQIATAGGNYCPGVQPDEGSAEGEGDTALRLWDVETGARRAIFQGSTKLLMGATFSPDGRSLAAGGWDGVVRVWDVATGQSREVARHDEGIQWVAYSPDGRQLASAGVDKTVRIWNAATGAKIAAQAHESVVMAVTYSADGKSLASADLEGYARIWDTQTWKLRREMRSYEGIDAAAFSTDGRFIVTTGTKAYVWETATGSRVEPIPPLPGWTGAFYGTAFSPDGRKVLVGGSGGRLGVFECVVCAPLSELLRLASQRPLRPITERERLDLFGGDDPSSSKP